MYWTHTSPDDNCVWSVDINVIMYKYHDDYICMHPSEHILNIAFQVVYIELYDIHCLPVMPSQFL